MHTSLIIALSGHDYSGKKPLAKLLSNFYSYKQVKGRKAGTNEGELSKVELASIKKAGLLVLIRDDGGDPYHIHQNQILELIAAKKDIVIICLPEELPSLQSYCKSMNWQLFTIFLDTPRTVRAQRMRDKGLNSELIKKNITPNMANKAGEIDFILNIDLGDEELFEEYVGSIEREIQDYRYK